MDTSGRKKVTPLLMDERRSQRIGSVLIELGKITEEDAERVSREQEEHGLKFGQTAVVLGLVSTADIQYALAYQFHAPVLSEAKSQLSRQLVAAHFPSSSGADAIRELRSHLLLRWFDDQRKSLCMMNCGLGDAASIMIANLAILFSYLRKRTLIVDANLRCPKQHKIFDLGEEQGLSEVLAGRADADAIRKLEPFHYLSVLPSGTIPPNPSELFYSPAFVEFQKILDARFDVILYDVPGLREAADGLTVASTLGGIVLAVEKDKTSVADIAAVKARLTGIDVSLVGCVLVQE